MSEHTPTPWQEGSDGYVIKIRSGTTNLVVASADRISDAQFIVRACNAHDELLRIVKSGRSHDPNCHYHLDKNYPCVHCKAIEKAEGKS